jgi:hypothetical protein
MEGQHTNVVHRPDAKPIAPTHPSTKPSEPSRSRLLRVRQGRVRHKTRTLAIKTERATRPLSYDPVIATFLRPSTHRQPPWPSPFSLPVLPFTPTTAPAGFRLPRHSVERTSCSRTSSVRISRCDFIGVDSHISASVGMLTVVRQEDGYLSISVNPAAPTVSLTHPAALEYTRNASHPVLQR